MAQDKLFWYGKRPPKPVTPPCPASSDWTDAKHGKTAQLAEPVLSFVEGFRQGPPNTKSVRTLGPAARRRNMGGKEASGNSMWLTASTDMS